MKKLFSAMSWCLWLGATSAFCAQANAKSGKPVPLKTETVWSSPLRPGASAGAQTSTPLIEATSEIVQRDFFAKDRLEHWQEHIRTTREQVTTPATESQQLLLIQALLQGLSASHTGVVREDEQLYWALTSIYSGHLDGERLRQIGAWFERRGSRWFVRDVFPGSPADRAGLLRGDEVITVDGAKFSPVGSFRETRPQGTVDIQIRRLPWGEPRSLKSETTVESMQEGWLRAFKHSHQLTEIGGKKIAYLPLWGCSHQDLKDAFLRELAWANHEADALIVDLRQDFGGADFTCHEGFFASGSAAQGQTKEAIYSKPLVALVGKGTSGGKEILAWLLKRQERATLVGQPTAGALAYGQLYELMPKHLALYLAVKPSPKGLPPDGEPIWPKVAVEDSLVYAAGQDETYKAGLAFLAKALP